MEKKTTYYISILWTIGLQLFFCMHLIGQSIDQLEIKISAAFDNSDYQLAKSGYLQTKLLYQQEEDWENYAIDYCKIANTYRLSGHLDSMKIYIDSSLIIAQKFQLDSLSNAYGWIWNAYGIYYDETGNPQAAFTAFNNVLKIDTVLLNQSVDIDSIFIGEDYQNIGTQLDSKGDYQEAINYYFYALPFLTKDLLETANVYNNIAFAYQNLKRPKAAIPYYHQTLSLLNEFEENGENQELQYAVFQNLATIYNDLSQYDSTFVYLDKMKHHPFINKGDYYHILGGTNRLLGNLDLAEKYLKDALAYKRQHLSNKHPEIALTHRELGQVYYEKEAYEMALQHYQLALCIIAWEFKDTTNFAKNPNLELSITDRRELLNVLNFKAASLAKLERSPLALATYLAALTLADKIRIGFQAEGSKYRLLDKLKPIFEATIQQALLLEDEALVFELIERGKAALLLENLQTIATKNFIGVPEELTNKEQQIKAEIAFKERALTDALHQQNQQNINKSNQELFHSRQIYQQLILELEQSYPEYHQLKYAVKYPSLKEVQQQLVGQHKTLIEYFVGDSSIIAFVIEAEKTWTYTIQKKQLITTIEQFRRSVETNDYHKKNFLDFTSTSHYLYKILLQPIISQLGKKVNELIIIPDGILGYVPFQALLKNPLAQLDFDEVRYDTLSYLLEDYAINYAYSSTLLLTQSVDNKKKTSTIDFGGFAPIFENGSTASNRRKSPLQKLEFSQAEITSIHDFLGGKIFLGPAATTEHFKQEVDQFKIIHLSTHAEAGASAIDTKIHFLDDYLTVKDIYNTAISADLTVLSACETGIGKLQRGEGIISMERAFMYAGCPSMVTSLWQVDDNKTATLMVHFYKNLKEGMSKPIALQQAQIEYLDNLTSVEAAHPFYWAAFIQTGASKPIFSSGIPFIKIIFGLSLFLLLLLGIFRKNKQ